MAVGRGPAIAAAEASAVPLYWITASICHKSNNPDDFIVYEGCLE